MRGGRRGRPARGSRARGRRALDGDAATPRRGGRRRRITGATPRARGRGSRGSRGGRAAGETVYSDGGDEAYLATLQPDDDDFLRESLQSDDDGALEDDGSEYLEESGSEPEGDRLSRSLAPGRRRTRVRQPCLPLFEEKDVPPLDLPKSSDDLLIPSTQLLNVAAVYEVLRNFSAVLRLSPFRFEDFCAALASQEQCALIAETHISLLKAILREEDSSSTSFGPADLKDSICSTLYFMDGMTWPEVVRAYCESVAEYRHVLPHLQDKDFPFDPLESKVKVLQFLVDQFLATNRAREVLMSEGVVRHDDHCRVCHLLGDLLCCETCSAVYHLDCIRPPLHVVPEDEWQCQVCAAHRVPGVGDSVTEAQKARPYVRQEPVGFDRHRRKYWFLNRRIVVEEDGEHENKVIWYYSSRLQLEELLELLDKAYWEKELAAALGRILPEVQTHMDITEDLTNKACGAGSSKCYLTVANEKVLERMKAKQLQQEDEEEVEQQQSRKSTEDRGRMVEDLNETFQGSNEPTSAVEVPSAAGVDCSAPKGQNADSPTVAPSISQTGAQTPTARTFEGPSGPGEEWTKGLEGLDEVPESAVEGTLKVPLWGPPTRMVTRLRNPDSKLSHLKSQLVHENRGYKEMMTMVNLQVDTSHFSPSSRGSKESAAKSESGPYFRLGQEGKYRLYQNQYSSNMLALNKHQRREDHDKRRHLAHKFCMSPAGDFKWNGSVHGSEAPTISTLRLAIVQLENNVPAPFMHPNWPSHRLKWIKAVHICSKAQELALALAILECAIKPVAVLPVWKETLGHTRLHRVTSMEREEKEKVKKREKKLEDEETLQQATWVKYTFPIKHQVWKQKGEEYRVTGYGGWSWISKTRCHRFLPRLPGNTNANYRKDVEAAETVYIKTSPESKIKRKPRGTLETQEEKMEAQQRADPGSQLPHFISDLDSEEGDKSQKRPFNYDVVDVSEGFLLRTAYKKVKASKLDGLLEHRVMQNALEGKQGQDQVDVGLFESKTSTGPSVGSTPLSAEVSAEQEVSSISQDQVASKLPSGTSSLLPKTSNKKTPRPDASEANGSVDLDDDLESTLLLNVRVNSQEPGIVTKVLSSSLVLTDSKPIRPMSGGKVTLLNADNGKIKTCSAVPLISKSKHLPNISNTPKILNRTQDTTSVSTDFKPQALRSEVTLSSSSNGSSAEQVTSITSADFHSKSNPTNRERSTREGVRLLKVMPMRKTSSGTALPSYCKFSTKSGKKSIFVLPSVDLRMLARRGGAVEVPSFSYSAKPALDVWPYPSPRPTFGITWRYRLRMATSLAGVSLMLRLLWACLRWDAMAVKPSSIAGTARTETSDTDIITTEIIKRREVGLYGIRSQYCIRKIISPIGVPDTSKEETATPVRKGLRASALRPKKPDLNNQKGPVVVDTWVPEEELELWEIRAFSEGLENEKAQAEEQAKISARRKTLELKARMEVRVNLERVDIEQKRLELKRSGSSSISTCTPTTPVSTNPKGSVGPLTSPVAPTTKVGLATKMSSPVSFQQNMDFQQTFATWVQQCQSAKGGVRQKAMRIVPPRSTGVQSQSATIRVQRDASGSPGRHKVFTTGGQLHPATTVIQAPVQQGGAIGKNILHTPHMVQQGQTQQVVTQVVRGQGVTPPVAGPMSASSSVTPTKPAAPRTPSGLQLKLTPAQQAQLTQGGVGQGLAVVVQGQSGGQSGGQLQIIPQGVTVVPGPNQQLMQALLPSGQIQHFLFTSSSRNSNPSTPAQTQQVTIPAQPGLQNAAMSPVQAGTLAPRTPPSTPQAQVPVQSPLQVKAIIGPALVKAQVTPHLITLPASQIQQPGQQKCNQSHAQKQVTMKQNMSMGSLKTKRGVSAAEREENQRMTVCNQVIKIILDKIDKDERQATKKRKHEEMVAQKNCLQNASKLSALLFKQKELLKAEILKKRALLDKELELEVQEELKMDLMKLRHEKEGTMAAASLASLDTALTIRNPSTITLSTSPYKRKREDELEAPSTKSKNISTTSKTCTDIKLYCICKTPYDESKFYIGCDLCTNWYHGECVGISEMDAKKMRDYVCSECRLAQQGSSEELYCVCRTPYDEAQFYIGCDRCQNWYHGRCVGILQSEATHIDEYVCPRCQSAEDPVLTSLTDQDYEGLRRILRSLQAHKMAWPFLEPVDPSKVPDYYGVIKEPMDLSTLEDRLQKHYYIKLTEFVADVTKMFDSCRYYNPSDSSFYQCAEVLETFFVHKLKAFKDDSWTPVKLQKLLEDDQGKREAPDLNFELRGKGCEYLCPCAYTGFLFFNKFAQTSSKREKRYHYEVLCVEF
ncbi:nucleosome-remodeling factor subunit BPTF-like isoform X2 [Denticeps clupeoides]|uniref:nucleosome-remodeling factor subunit BPTF-like isoform X2 n=1 Tax=Denticeps clupeoides TaxID=299321 RepID=UPI0010A38BAE|nr:nucleosome-remodeling factor subunit BPTF isoform X2 [Denticeps clupeoides]